MFLFALFVIIGVILSVASMPCRNCTDVTVDSKTDYEDFALEKDRERDCLEELLYCLHSMSHEDNSKAGNKYDKNNSYCRTLEWCQNKNKKLYGGTKLNKALAPLFNSFFL